jgi:hypothetical protein
VFSAIVTLCEKWGRQAAVDSQESPAQAGADRVKFPQMDVAKLMHELHGHGVGVFV